MAGHIMIVLTDSTEGKKRSRAAFVVAERSEHRAIALFKLRPGHTADEQIEAVAEVSQSFLSALGIQIGEIRKL
jgi:hypothetical protein